MKPLLNPWRALMVLLLSAQLGMAAAATGIVPAHDPADVAFRRAPMPQSSRSIVVPLATNLHMAFDAALLRTHTLWSGESLNLHGPPFSGSATRFICDYTGTRLWGSVPRMPWCFDLSNRSATTAQFKGVDASSGRIAFVYEVKKGGTAPVRITESPRVERIDGHDVVIRRFEIGRSEERIFLSAHDEPGEALSLEGAGGIRRTNNVLVAVVRGLPSQNLTCVSSHDPLEELLWIERDGKGPYSAHVTNHITSGTAILQVEIPPGSQTRSFEIASAVVSNVETATAIAHRLSVDTPSAARLPIKTAPRIYLPDPAFTDKPAGDEFYTVEHFPIPKEIRLTVAGMDFLPNGDLAVATFQGDVFIVEGATGSTKAARWRTFARGLNEPGGLRVVNGDIYVMQKCELTRLRDRDGDGAADTFECVSDAWGYTGNYHSYATGPLVDSQGNLYALITGHRTIREVSFMGWCLKVTPQAARTAGSRLPFEDDWKTEPYCSGLRVPNGFGESGGDLFMTDNQGHWIAANKLNHLQPGNDYGHPSAQPSPPSLFNGNPDVTPPAVWFPYAWVRSASGIASVGRGPFAGQMLVGEFQNAAVFRVALEKVNGQWQGAVFPFAKGFGSGVNRIFFGPDGRLYAGGLKLGHWTSIASQPHSLDRVTFTDRTPFEIREVHATATGFELRFTQPVDTTSAGNAENWDAVQYTYAYDGRHNAPEKDRDEKIAGPSLNVTKAEVSADRLSVRLTMTGLKPRHVILLRASEVLNTGGARLRNDTCHYTLNHLPR